MEVRLITQEEWNEECESRLPPRFKNVRELSDYLIRSGIREMGERQILEMIMNHPVQRMREKMYAEFNAYRVSCEKPERLRKNALDARRLGIISQKVLDAELARIAEIEKDNDRQATQRIKEI